MKMLPESTTSLLVLLLLMELPVLSMSHPTPMNLHQDNLTDLFRQMLRLLNLVNGVLGHLDKDKPSQYTLTSLPTITFRPHDLKFVEVNKTLSQLSLGMESFKMHFDWLRYWQNQSGFKSHRIEEITHQIQAIIHLTDLIQRQTHKSVQNNTLQQPPPTSAWDLTEKCAEIHRKLQLFCDWYIRALRILRHNAGKKLQPQLE